MTRCRKHIGSTVEDFLAEEGILKSATKHAIKTVIAWQLTEEMKRQKITKTQMAKSLNTSRSQINRILDPTYEGVTIGALNNVAKALGRELVIELR